jgi:4-hydroxyphenylpyruvate dioxygenase-like putative hemolysin
VTDGSGSLAEVPRDGKILRTASRKSRKFINKHGNGVHHLGFEVGDARDEVIRELKEMGFDTERTIGVYPGSSWTIVDSEDVLGVNLNIKPKR